MTDYKNLNVNDLQDLYTMVNSFYTALTGKQTDDNIERRLKAGVEGLLVLYNLNPDAFYAAAATAVLEGADKLKLNEDARQYLKDVAQYLAQQSKYSNLEQKLENNNSQGGQ